MPDTIDTISDILGLFTSDRPEWDAAEVSAATRLPASGVHVLLTGLTETGLLRPTPDGSFGIGWRVDRLGELLDAGGAADPYGIDVLGGLARRTGQAAHLAVLERGRVLCIDELGADGSGGVLHAGANLDLHSAAGQVLLADRAHSDVRQLLLETPGLQTATEPSAVLDALALVRTQGFAVRADDPATGRYGVAAPVVDENGVVVAALGLTASAERFADGGLPEAVAAEGASVSEQITARGPGRWWRLRVTADCLSSKGMRSGRGLGALR